MIRAIAVRRRSDAPVDARGVAYLRELLCNGDTPVHAPSPAGVPTAELHAISKMLDVQD